MGLKKILGKIAPVAVSVASSGLLGGGVAESITKALGLGKGASEGDIEAALAKASPEQLTEIKRIEAETVRQANEIGFKTKELEARGAEQQFELNKKQLDSRHWFVAAARPAAMWICNVVIACFYIPPSIAYGARCFADAWHRVPMGTPPIEIEHILVMLMQMLGLGYLRSKDKGEGVTHR